MAPAIGLTAAALMASSAQAGLIDALQAAKGQELTFKYLGGTTGQNVKGVGAGTLPETTWGVGRLTQVLDANDNPIWQEGATPGPVTDNHNEQVTFMLYGVGDLRIRDDGMGNVNIWNTGCQSGPCDGNIHLDFYLDTFSPNDTDFNDDGPGVRSDFDSAGDWTDGTPLMAWLLEPGVVVDDPSTAGIDESQASLFQTVNNSVLTPNTRGNGNFFASCVPGSAACALLNSNGFTTFDGTAADFSGAFTLNQAGTQGRGAYEGDINDPVLSGVVSVPIPEPASLGVLGSGLVLLGGALRRRRRD